jgi:hypothetical protein
MSERLAPRHHIALTGGVLIRGWSVHDIDVIVYPASSLDWNDASRVAVREVLVAMGMELRVDVGEMHRNWRLKGSHDRKHVEAWALHGKRIDIFFLT